MSNVPLTLTFILWALVAPMESQSGADPKASGTGLTPVGTTIRPAFLRQNLSPVVTTGGPTPNVIPWTSGRQPSSPNVGILMNFTEYPATKPGTPVAAFNAFGNTPWAGQTYQFFIAPSSNPHGVFKIDPKTGQLTVDGILDHEQADQYLLKIGASDNDNNIGYTPVTIYVNDLNDNAPELLYQNQPVIKQNIPPEYKIATVFAKDADGPGNGPPFQFAEPNNSTLRDKFRIVPVPTLDGGNGGFEIWSRVQFEGEAGRVYQVPVVVSDSGKPQMSAIRNVEVRVIDEMENPLTDPTKFILVYSYKGELQTSSIGRIHIEDTDENAAKTNKLFDFGPGPKPTNFRLDPQSGLITIEAQTPQGNYSFRVNVTDTKTREKASSAVVVRVEHLPHDAVIKSGSLRLQGINAEEFLSKVNGSSPYERMVVKLAEYLAPQNVKIHIFSIIETKDQQGPVLELRVAAITDTGSYKPSMAVNGLIQLHRREFSNFVKVTILEVGINPCFTTKCDGGCTNLITASSATGVVVGNRGFTVVGVNTMTKAQCGCASTAVSSGCSADSCLNGGICHETGTDFFCECRDPKLQGSRCQGLTRTFGGNSFAWFKPLPNCDHFDLSLQFITTSPSVQIFYNGPTDMKDLTNFEKSHYVALSLYEGKPILQLEFGFGVGTMYFPTDAGLALMNDGEWHTIEISRAKQTVELTVDRCRNARVKADGSIDVISCKLVATIPGPVDALSISAPFQLAGMARSGESVYPATLPNVGGFDGCIRELKINGETLDMFDPILEDKSAVGCGKTDKFCGNGTQSLCIHGDCLASMTLTGTPHCICEPGWTGDRCDKKSTWVQFNQRSFVQYIMDQKARGDVTYDMKMLFFPQKPSGTLLRSSSSNASQYTALEMDDYKLRMIYGSTQLPRQVGLEGIRLANNQSYFVHFERVNAYGKIILDNLQYPFDRETADNATVIGMRLNQDKLVVGAESDQLTSDFEGCVADVWVNGFYIPLEESVGFTNPYLKMGAKFNVESGCASFPTCAKFKGLCQSPSECVDFWKGPFCTCPAGTPTVLDDRGRLSSCGEASARHVDIQLGITAGGIIAIVISALALIMLIMFVVFWIYRHPKKVVYPSSDSDSFENLKNDVYEGGGEHDQNSYDLSHLRRPVNDYQREPVVPDPNLKSHNLPSKYDGVGDLLGDRLVDADLDPVAPPFDELRQFDYEGDRMSRASSLSSLASSTDSDPDWERRLNSWGPRFQQLADMYGGEEE